MSDPTIWPTIDKTYTESDLQNLTYIDADGNEVPYPIMNTGSGYVQTENGTIEDQTAYDKDQVTGFTNPNLHRRIDIHEPETNVNPNLLSSVPDFYESSGSDTFLIYRIPLTEDLIAGKTYTIQLWNVDICYEYIIPEEYCIFIVWGKKINYISDINIPNGHSDYLAFTFVAQNRDVGASTNPWIDIYDVSEGTSESTTHYVHIEQWKLESGDTATPLDKELAPREYTLEIKGTNSYRTTTITVHDEESTTSEIP